MKDLKGKIAVVTGGGTGMGRELVRQLVAEGCHVATCDIIPENLEETVSLVSGEAAPGVRVTGHVCDVAMADQVNVFKGEVEAQHGSPHINLLFNNAGIGGGGSFVASTQEEWERGPSTSVGTASTSCAGLSCPCCWQVRKGMSSTPAASTASGLLSEVTCRTPLTAQRSSPLGDSPRD